MKVTDKEIPLDSMLVRKLDLMVERMNRKFDNLVLIDGDEGYGKSNLAAGICYYVAWKTGRKYNVDNVFFDLDKLINFAMKTEEQIIHWDEGALGGLSLQWWNKNQIKFIQLLMVARKKKHFFVICIPKFFKLQEYLVVDRSIALLHVYAQNELSIGKFSYYNKRSKEKLFYDWKHKKVRNYKKYFDIRGTFSQNLPRVLDEDAYEEKKNAGILSLNKEDENKPLNKQSIEKETRSKVIPKLKQRGFTDKEIAEFFEVSERSIQRDNRDIRNATTDNRQTYSISGMDNFDDKPSIEVLK